MFEEFIWAKTHTYRETGDYESFEYVLESQDELVTEFLGRSVPERQKYLISCWLKNYRNFDILFWLVIVRANQSHYPKYDPRDYRRALYGIDRVDSGAVNAWYNSNKYGSTH